MPKYRLLMDEYRRQLEERYQKGEIQKITMEAHQKDVNRILESVIKIFPPRIIEATIREAGFGASGSYIRVTKDLKSLIEKRKR